MTGFQHVGVLDLIGPHVTPVAGVEVAGRYWATTAVTAAKVRAIRSGSPAAVLDQDGDGWTLTVGPATVLDLRRPFDGLADPVSVGFAGAALIRLGLAHADQIAGYVRDGAAVPSRWRPAARVLLVVQAEHRLRWVAGAPVRATGRFVRGDDLASATRQRRRPVGTAILRRLSPDIRLLVGEERQCCVGLSSAVGPVVVPGRWDPRGTVSVDTAALRHLHVQLPGPCAVTLDDDGDGVARPTSKRGVMLRGDAALMRSPLGLGGETELAIRVWRATAWTGFESTTSSTPTRRAG